MSSVVKGAIGVGAGLVAILGVSAIAISTEGFGAGSETPWQGILESDTTYSSWHAHSYKAFLVDPNNSKDGGEESWKLLSSNKSNVGYKFKDVKDVNALNKVCAEAYKSSNGDATETQLNKQTRSDDKYDGRDIFTYCSPLRGLPSKVPANKYEPNQIGSLPSGIEGTLGGGLVDIDGNDKFGEIKNDRFKSYDSNIVTQEFFQKRKVKGIHLRDICKESYDLNQPEKGPHELYTKYCIW